MRIPSSYRGTPDATLDVESDEYGDSYTLTLTAADGHIIASASGFRPGAGHDFGDNPHTAATFGAFLAAALEDGESASNWDVLADDAADWADAFLLMDEQ